MSDSSTTTIVEMPPRARQFDKHVVEVQMVDVSTTTTTLVEMSSWVVQLNKLAVERWTN